MERRLLRVLLLTAAAVGAGGAGVGTGGQPVPAPPPCQDARRLEVDRLEGALAVVLPAGGRAARTLPRAALPAGTREGDVVVAGVRRPDCRRVLLGQLGRLRARLRGSVPGTDALTPGGEK